MYSLFKSDVYRLLHGKMLWVCLAIVVVVIISTSAMVWFTSTEMFQNMMINATTSSSVDASTSVSSTGTTTLEGPTATVTASKPTASSLSFLTSQAVFSGGIMSLLLGLIAALLMASDFDTGFAKGIFSARRNRVAYYTEKLILLFMLSVVAIIISLAVSFVAAGLFGITFTQPDNPGALLIWVLLAALILFFYAAFAAFLVWVVRSKAAGILWAALVGSHFIGAIATQILQMIVPGQAMRDALSWLPISCVKTASVGSSVVFQAAEGTALAPGVQLTLAGLIAAGIVVAISLIFAPKKDI